ncbi:MAG TPA: hypothetical protein VGC27_10605 [Rhizomicrobium sp.]
MPRRPFTFITAALTSAVLVTTPFAPALAGGGSQYGNQGGSRYGNQGGFHGKPASCNNGGSVVVNKPVSINKNINVYKPTTVNNSVNVYKPVTINKDINVYKPTTINKEINVYKPVTINKDVNIYKPITINKDVNITKNIDNSKNITVNKNVNIEKNVNINKSIVINKGGGGGSAEASAFAQAMASASANASVSNNVIFYGGGNYEYVTVNNRSSDISGIQTTQQCQVQEANVVKAIHAVCVSSDGREFPASHMTGLTWLNSSYEGEVMRCIPGSHLKVVIGDVLQSDQGMVGTYASGQVLECGGREALRHYKDGMLKCAPAVPVPDCTERNNLRLYGTSDMFFSYRASVCVSGAQTASRDLELTGMSLDGGVGDGSGN